MVSEISPFELSAWMQAKRPHGQPVLLDVREPWECERASVAPQGDWRLLAIPMNEVPRRLAELDPARPVACLCHHGARSQRVAQFLAQSGFTHVANVSGGIDAWSQQVDGSVPRY